MNCQEMTELLTGYLDHELDLVRSLAAERHLKECPACSQCYHEQQALRRVMADPALYFEAPRGVVQSVRTAVRQASRAEAQPARLSWKGVLLWARWLAPTAVAAVVLLLALPGLMRPPAESRLTREIVSAHIRSLIADHLTDVVSTDQHTVKPWFNGKMTFSPPVADLSNRGFPLVGGRLDVLEDQPVAAVVYQRRKHFINLFIRPSSPDENSREELLAQRGYNLVHWSAGGMDYWAVSDVRQGDLQEFVKLVRGKTIQPGGR